MPDTENVTIRLKTSSAITGPSGVLVCLNITTVAPSSPKTAPEAPSEFMKPPASRKANALPARPDNR